MKRKIFILFMVCIFIVNVADAKPLKLGHHANAALLLKPIPAIVPIRNLPPIRGIKPIKMVSNKVSAPKPVVKRAPIKGDKPLVVKTSTDTVVYKKISMQEAIDYAMKNNLDIKNYRIEIPKSKNDIKSANQLKNPSIQSFFNGGTAAIDNPNNIGIMFPFEIAKRGARKRLAKSTFELTKGNVALAEFQLRLAVRADYINLASAKSKLKILQEQRSLLQNLLDIANKKYQAGASPEMDVIQAKMNLNQLIIQENSARNDVLVARYNFNRILFSNAFDTKEDFLPQSCPGKCGFIELLTPVPTDSIPSFDEFLKIALENRPDLKNAKMEIDVAKKKLVTVIRQRVPDIEVGGGYMFVSNELSSTDKTTHGEYVSGNITNIPLFYQYSPEIKNAKLEVEQKQMAYDALKRKATMDLHATYDQFLTSQANLNHYNDVLLSESNKFLAMAKRSYEVGKTNITNFIFIQQSYKSIFMGYNDSLKDYYSSWLDLIKEVNDENVMVEKEEIKLNEK